MCAGFPTAGSSSSCLSRPDNEFETDRFTCFAFFPPERLAPESVAACANNAVPMGPSSSSCGLRSVEGRVAGCRERRRPGADLVQRGVRTKSQYQTLNRERSVSHAFQPHSEVGQYETSL